MYITGKFHHIFWVAISNHMLFVFQTPGKQLWTVFNDLGQNIRQLSRVRISLGWQS